MKFAFIFLVGFMVTACQEVDPFWEVKVTSVEELTEVLSNAKPGYEIVLSNGIWRDVQIRFIGEGIRNRPIILRAETPGKVFIEGKSDLKLSGQFLVVSGLYFRNGSTPSSAVIEFQTDDNNYAFNCRVSECVIENYNQSQRNKSDLWVQFKGRHNQLDHCYLVGKSNRGPTVRVDLEGIESINNYHKIIDNHFGPRPPKGGPSAETIQIGSSSTSMTPSYTLVANNLFERCNGEVEVISSKSNFNEFRNNVFYKSEGSLVTRHGNYCILDGNYFIGDNNSNNIGGIRLIGTGHWVTNNYFYNLKGENFRSPLAVMNGIPKSPLNRYIQVTDVVVAYNSWINCVSPWHFGVGSNVDMEDVLPASEIRSARPERVIVANNLIYNNLGDKQPIVAHDKLDGIEFHSNVAYNNDVPFDTLDGVVVQYFVLNNLSENLFVPESNFSDVALFSGFEFESITNDLFGNSRTNNNSIGAVANNSTSVQEILNYSKYGPSWFDAVKQNNETQKHVVDSTVDLYKILASAGHGDTIKLEPGKYVLSTSLKIDKSVVLESLDPASSVSMVYEGESGTPAFEMNPNGHLSLNHIHLKGSVNQMAIAPLQNDMSGLYNLNISNCKISGFDYVFKAYKYSFSENINFTNCNFYDCNNGLELSEETEDKGEYNAENIVIKNCRFEKIGKNVIDYYRGGYDESTIGGNLIVENSFFTKCGKKERSGTLIKSYGIINVALKDNTFENNLVKRVALLWGAKNNVHSGNKIKRSGTIEVEENLKQKLLY